MKTNFLGNFLFGYADVLVSEVEQKQIGPHATNKNVRVRCTSFATSYLPYEFHFVAVG